MGPFLWQDRYKESSLPSFKEIDLPNFQEGDLPHFTPLVPQGMTHAWQTGQLFLLQNCSLLQLFRCCMG